MKSEGDGHIKAPISKIHPTNVVGLEGVIEETEDATTLDYGLSPTFTTSTAAKQWCKRNLTYGCSVYGIFGPDGKKPGSGYIKYRGALRPLLAEADLRAGPRATGANTTARVMPVSWFRSLDGASGLARVMPVVDIQQAIAGSSRVMPVITAETIGWIAIYKKNKLRKFTIKNLLAARPV
jgi:hypothetical protein